MPPKRKRLTRLRVTSVDAVDRGAGEGVRIVLMKRDADPPALAPTSREYRKMGRKDIVAVAKNFVEQGGEITLEKRDFYGAMLKGAEKSRLPGQSSAQAFARYLETTDGRALHECCKRADGPDPAVSLDPPPRTSYEALERERNSCIAKAEAANQDWARNVDEAIAAITATYLASGKYRSYAEARAAAERSPKVRAMRSAGSIYRQPRAAATA